MAHTKFITIWRRHWWLILLSMMLCCCLLFWLAHRMGCTRVGYESMAIIELEPLKDDPESNEKATLLSDSILSGRSLDPIINPSSYILASQDKKLQNYFASDEASRMELIYKHMRISSREVTGLLEIRGRHSDSQFAYDLVQALCEVIRTKRIRQKKTVRENTLKPMLMDLQNKSDRVLQLKKRLLGLEKLLAGQVNAGKERTTRERVLVNEELAFAEDVLMQKHQQYEQETIRLGADLYGIIIRQEAEVATLPVNYNMLIGVILTCVPISFYVSCVWVSFLYRFRDNSSY